LELSSIVDFRLWTKKRVLAERCAVLVVHFIFLFNAKLSRLRGAVVASASPRAICQRRFRVERFVLSHRPSKNRGRAFLKLSTLIGRHGSPPTFGRVVCAGDWFNVPAPRSRRPDGINPCGAALGTTINAISILERKGFVRKTRKRRRLWHCSFFCFSSLVSSRCCQRCCASPCI
jgi:hypothetical protein